MAVGRASVVFNADASQYLRSLAEMDQATGKTAATAQQAQNKILALHNARVRIAVEEGKGLQELSRITADTAKMMANVTETNFAKQGRAADELRAKLVKVHEEWAKLPNLPTPQIPGEGGGLGDVPNRLKTSTVLRVAEGTTSIRGAEAFISSVPVLSKLSDLVFPIASAAGFAAIVGEGVSKLKEMYDTAKDLPDAIQSGFRAINSTIESNVDNLRVQNDELDMTIAKLEGKPNNGIALSLDEARRNADRLYSSILQDTKAVQDLAKQNAPTWLSQLLSGHLGTMAGVGSAKLEQDVRDEITKRQNNISDLSFANKEATRSGHDTPAAAAARAKAIRDAQQSLASYSDTQLRSNTNNWMSRASVELLQGTKANTEDQIDLSDQQSRNATSTAKEKQLQKTKGLGVDKAAEERFKALEAQVTQWKLAGTASEQVIYDFWKRNQSSFAQGSEQFNQVQEKMLTIVTANRSKWAEVRKKVMGGDMVGANDLALGREKPAENDEGQRAYDAGQKGLDDWRKADARKADEAMKAQQRADLGKANGAAQYKLAGVAIAEQTGKISQMDAAQQRANIHAQQYADIQAQLRIDLDNARKSDNPADAINAQAAIDKAAADRAIQLNQDAAALAAASWETSLKSAYDQWYQHAKDTAGQVRELFNQGINGANQNLVDMMTERHPQRGMWKKYGHEMFKSAAGDALQQGEARLLGPLGLGKKADGSKENPWYVIDASQGGAGATGGLMSHIGGLGKLFHPGSGGADGGSGDDQSSGVGGFFKSVFSALAGAFVGGKALGGGVDQSGFYDVGEMGRERVWLPKGSAVQPHNQMTGGGSIYSIQVANGVTPEQVDMRVRAALQEAHPHIVRASVQAVHEHQQRVASPRR